MRNPPHLVDVALDQEAPVAAARPARLPLVWLVRCELWGNRSLWVVPLVVAAVILVGFAIAAIARPVETFGLSELDPARRRVLIDRPTSAASFLILVSGAVAAAFYCADALHGERRDHSLWFWKSLPVSDAAAVFAKAAIPLAVVPGLLIAITVATRLAMLLVGAAVLLLHGQAPPWTPLSVVEMQLVLVVALGAATLWHAPLYAWLIFVSAWARRVPLLWAVLPVLAAGALERVLFGTGHLAGLSRHRATGYFDLLFPAAGGAPGPLRFAAMDMRSFLASLEFWIGLAAAAGLLAAAARLRRSRGPL